MTKKKEKESERRKLDIKIEALEQQHKTTYSQDTLRPLIETCMTLDTLLSEKAEGCYHAKIL